MLIWPSVDSEPGITEEEEEEEEQEETPEEDAWVPVEGIGGAWGFVGELMGM